MAEDILADLVHSRLLDVTARGAVRLGPTVCCDGFLYGVPIRVQTHVHMDHMDGFDSSKGCQHIIMTEATRGLLIAEYNAELRYRANVIGLNYGSAWEHEACTVVLQPSGHMLGAAQVSVCSPDGLRLGYSGDFNWPLDHVVQVDALVIDSTSGSPACVRTYSQDYAREEFARRVCNGLRSGSVHAKAHPGTLHHALTALDGVLVTPMLVSAKLKRELDVYRRHGYVVPDYVVDDTNDGRAIVRDGKYLRVYSKGDTWPCDDDGLTTTIVLSACVNPLGPGVIEFSERACRIAITGHADFNGTMDYVAATGARLVVVDNSRGGHAIALTAALNSRLGVSAVLSSGKLGQHWGE